MNAQIELAYSTPAWYSTGGDGPQGVQPPQVWARGQAWIGDTHYEGKALSEWIWKELSPSFPDVSLVFKDRLQSLNGHYAVVVQSEDQVLAAVDGMRSLPLFYALKGEGLVISDSAEIVFEAIKEVGVDEFAVQEFLLTGYVTGPDTLFPNLKQLQAGEYLHWDRRHPRRVTTGEHFVFCLETPFEGPEEHFKDRMQEVYEHIFDRFLRGVNGRRIAIPLSAGKDSRSIAAMLKRLGAVDVLCVSYGKEGFWEAAASQRVAAQLGYAWHFERLTPALWRKHFRDWDGQTAYLRFSSGAAIMSLLQDWLAIKLMREKGVLQEGDVIAPGHAGDSLAGSKVPRQMKENEVWSARRVVEAILGRHYKHWPWGPDREKLRCAFSERVRRQMGVEGDMPAREAASVIERWSHLERTSKFIINSLRVYEYWGFEWRVPIWDMELIDLWMQAPISLRLAKRYYSRFLSERLFSSLGVDGGFYSGRRNLGHKGEIARSALEALTHPSIGRYSLGDIYNALVDHNQYLHTGLLASPHLLKFNNLTASLVLRAWAGNG